MLFALQQDYTGEDVTVNNVFAAILGNKSATTGGSGKVVESGPNDHIFIYYSDHGGPGVLGMFSFLMSINSLVFFERIHYMFVFGNGSL